MGNVGEVQEDANGRLPTFHPRTAAAWSSVLMLLLGRSVLAGIQTVPALMSALGERRLEVAFGQHLSELAQEWQFAANPARCLSSSRLPSNVPGFAIDQH